MRRRPVYLGILSFIFMCIAISYPIQVMVLYGHNIFELDQIFYKISLLNSLTAISLLANSILLLNASRHLRVTVPISMVLMIWSNLVVGSFGHDYSMMITSMASIGFAMICVPLVASSEILMLMNDPSKHWWKTPPRVRKNCIAAIQPQKGYNILAETYDISENGIYVPFSTCVEKDTKEYLLDPSLKVGEIITLHIRLSQFNTIKCEAQVVRVVKKNDAKPAGMGLHFLKLDEHTKSQIKKYISLVA